MQSSSPTPPTPLSRALETIKRLRAQLDEQRGCHALAVVGVGLRFPGGIDSLGGYWQALRDGRDLVRAMPEARKARFAAEWDTLPHKGGFLDGDVTGFDAGFFGISPREARAIDPQHRLLLEVAWEALENAALPPERLRDARPGLYVGITGSDYRDWQVGEPDAYWATGNGHCFAAGRLAYAMGFTGPAVAVDTACSSSLVAVHLASQAVRRGECDVAVAGGVNLILSPRSTRTIQQTRALSPDGLCKTFDARANGFTRGEGCGAIVIKRLDRAVRDGDRIHAVIRGSAINQDGRSSGFTAPNVLSQISLIEAALADAALTPADIGMVEAHGTGTSLGDPIEMEALVAAIGKKSAGARLHVGSVKTNFGHLEAAAGIAGLIKAIACCANRAVPGLVHYRTQNPRIDLAGADIALSGDTVPWSAAGRFAGVSSFGISGTNAHVIVGPADSAGEVSGEAVEAQAAAAVTGFELSARTPEALRTLAGRYRAALAELPAADYAAFAYTATAGRARHAVRARIAAADPAAALAALDALAAGESTAAVAIGTGAAGEAIGEALPRRIVELPHYPWQRESHAPDAPDAPVVAVTATVATVITAPQIAVAPVAVDAPTAPVASATASTAAIDVLAEVHSRIAALLGYTDAAGVPDDASLFDLGLDSLMAADLARGLSELLGVEVSLDQIFHHPSVRELAAAIGAAQPASTAAAAPRTARTPRVAFLFACQGGQYFGMGRELYDTEPVFRAKIDACDRILAPQLGASIVDLMMRGDDHDAIHQTRVTQPVLVALELALADLWTSRGVTPVAVIGHSFGEIAAAIHAGVMSLEDGLTLVAHRGRLMQSTGHGAMMAVGAPLAEVTAWLAGTGLDIAAVNGPASIVVSGARPAIDELAARLTAGGITARVLAVSHASHSQLMDPIVGPLRDAIAGLAFGAPRLPIIANLTGGLAGDGDYSADYWARHLRQPVQFCDGVRALRALDIDAVIEIGPGGTLIGIVESAGLLPAGGGAASLRRGTGERASLRAAAVALGLAVDETRAAPAPRTQRVARTRLFHPVRTRPGDRRRPSARRHLSVNRDRAGRTGDQELR